MSDQLLNQITDYVCDFEIESELAYKTASWCLLDSLGCSFLALDFPACTKMLGPIVPGADMKGGARVPGTEYELDPVMAAFNIGTLVRWLDFNDTWLAAEWGQFLKDAMSIWGEVWLSRSSLNPTKINLKCTPSSHSLVPDIVGC